MKYQENLALDSHPELIGKHAPFSPSQRYWIDYEPDRLLEYWDNKDAQMIGTEIHARAKAIIDMQWWFWENNIPINLSLSHKDTFSQHVNSAIKYYMKAEVPVKYSDICFGTADALSFHIPTRTLRIHDLKTGKMQGDIRQLEQYAAVFFAEYSPTLQYQHHIDLSECKIELRIFQYNQCRLVEPPVDYIIEEVLSKARAQHEVLAEALNRREYNAKHVR